MTLSDVSRAEPVYNIDIPSMNAAEALNRFAAQTGTIMLFPYDLASTRKSNAVKGRYTLLEGLELLLQDTGLSGGLSDKRVVNISTSENEQRLSEVRAMSEKKVSLGKKVTAFVASVFSASAVSAQENRAAGVEAIEEIVVTGQALATQRALDSKRRSSAIMDAVAADDMSLMPVKNAAEVASFLPGVSMDVDQGEGREVIIRGAAPYLNNVTLNGSTIGSPSDGREVPLDVIGAELLKGIEVVKAVTPDMDHQAIGGSVNILTYSPFDFDGRAVGSLRVGYEDYSGDVPYSASLQTGTRFGEDETWGVLVGASYSLRQFETKFLPIDSWGTAATAAADGTVTTFDTPLPQQVAGNFYQIERERWSVSAALERRIQGESRIFLRTLYSWFPEDEQRDRIEQRISQEVDGLMFTGSVDGTSGTFGPITVVEDGEIDEVNLRRHSELQTLERGPRVLNVTGGGEQRFGLFDLYYEVTYNDNQFDDEGVNWEFRNTNTSGTWDVGSMPTLMFAVDESDYDPNEYRMQRFRTFNEVADEKSIAAKVDLRYDLEQLSGNGYLKFGVSYRDVEKNHDFNQVYYDFGDTCTIGQFNLQTSPVTNTVDGVSYRIEPRVDPAAALAFFRDAPNCFEFDPAGTLEDSVLSDFSIDETVAAGYAMVSYDVSDEFNVLAGVRVEYTEDVANASTLDFTSLDELLDSGGNPAEAVSPAPASEGSYSNVMPGLHLRYNLGDSLVLRAAYTNTIGRPFLSDLSPTTELEFTDDPADPSRFIGEISTGNIDLEPYTSQNFDFAAEYYLADNLGIVSASIFYKSVDDYILRRVRRVEDVIFNDRDFSILDIDEPFNAEGGDIQGIELNYRQQWTELPGWWGGFGGAISATLVDASLDIGDREIPFPFQSDEIYSVQLFYTAERVEASFTYNRQSDFLDSVEDDASLDIWQKDRSRMSFHGRYALTENLSLILEWQNILDEPRWAYQGRRDPSRVVGYDYFGSTAYVGLTFRY